MSAAQRGLGVEPGLVATLEQSALGDRPPLDGGDQASASIERPSARSVGRLLRRVAAFTIVLGTVVGLVAWVVALAYLTSWLIHLVPL